MRLGIDALIGLVPIVGDLVSQVISTYIIWEARQLGVSRFTIARMIGNTAIDTVVGLVPFAGDAFDVVFRANMKNLALLKAPLAKRARTVTWAAARHQVRHRHPARRVELAGSVESGSKVTLGACLRPRASPPITMNMPQHWRCWAQGLWSAPGFRPKRGTRRSHDGSAAVCVVGQQSVGGGVAHGCAEPWPCSRRSRRAWSLAGLLDLGSPAAWCRCALALRHRPAQHSVRPLLFVDGRFQAARSRPSPARLVPKESARRAEQLDPTPASGAKHLSRHFGRRRRRRLRSRSSSRLDVRRGATVPSFRVRLTGTSTGALLGAVSLPPLAPKGSRSALKARLHGDVAPWTSSAPSRSSPPFRRLAQPTPSALRGVFLTQPLSR